MTKSQAQEIIDQAIGKRFRRYDDAEGEQGAEWMLELLRDRPELLVAIDEVAALVKAASEESWMYTWIKPFIKEES